MIFLQIERKRDSNGILSQSSSLINVKISIISLITQFFYDLTKKEMIF